MSRKLEIILRATGNAELVDDTDETIWSSDADENFREKVSQEFLTEDDVDDILDYLSDNNIITEREAVRFETGEWDVTEESLPGETTDNATAIDVNDSDDDDDDENFDEEDDE